jgi:uncharacterized protein (DUF2062 family)
VSTEGRVARWRAGFRQRLRTKLNELSGAHETPRRLAVAVGIGVLCGCSPFLGFQTLIALGAAFLFRLNKLAVLIGLQISVPPITPLVIFASLALGEWMLHGRALVLSLAQMRALPVRLLLEQFLLDLTVGGLTLGAVLGFVLGALAERWIIRRRARVGPT